MIKNVYNFIKKRLDSFCFKDYYKDLTLYYKDNEKNVIAIKKNNVLNFFVNGNYTLSIVKDFKAIRNNEVKVIDAIILSKRTFSKCYLTMVDNEIKSESIDISLYTNICNIAIDFENELDKNHIISFYDFPYSITVEGLFNPESQKNTFNYVNIKKSYLIGGTKHPLLKNCYNFNEYFNKTSNKLNKLSHLVTNYERLFKTNFYKVDC